MGGVWASTCLSFFPSLFCFYSWRNMLPWRLEVVQRQITVHPAIWPSNLLGLGCQRAAGLMNDDDIYEHCVEVTCVWSRFRVYSILCLGVEAEMKSRAIHRGHTVLVIVQIKISRVNYDDEQPSHVVSILQVASVQLIDIYGVQRIFQSPAILACVAKCY